MIPRVGAVEFVKGIVVGRGYFEIQFSSASASYIGKSKGGYRYSTCLRSCQRVISNANYVV